MKKYILIISIVLISINSYLFTHPHLFIYYDASFTFKDKKLKYIEVTWNFGKMFTASSISTFDRNQNNRLDPPEYEEFEDTIYSNMDSVNYFITTKVNKKNYSNFQADEFFIEQLDDGNFTATFFIYPDLKASSDLTEFSLFFEDDSNYTAFTTIQKEIEYKADETVIVTKKKIIDEYEHMIQFILKK